MTDPTRSTAPPARWRCCYCHDEMDRKFRRWHLRMEWICRLVRQRREVQLVTHTAPHEHEWEDTGFATVENCSVEGCLALRSDGQVTRNNDGTPRIAPQ